MDKERVGLSWHMLNEWPDCTDAVRICINRFDQMGLDARKPVFGGLRITQAQTSLRIRAV